MVQPPAYAYREKGLLELCENAFQDSEEKYNASSKIETRRKIKSLKLLVKSFYRKYGKKE